MLLSLRGDERAELGLFFDDPAREEICFQFESFVHQHLEQYIKGEIPRRRRFICTDCGLIFKDEDVGYRLERKLAFINCPRCDTSNALVDGIERVNRQDRRW